MRQTRLNRRTVSVAVLFGTAACLIPELNQRPIVDFTFAGRPDGVTVAFIPNVTDPDGEVEELTWDFGDGGSVLKVDPRAAQRAGDAPIAVHTYPRSGEYTVILTATDDNRQAQARDKTVRVGPNLPPSATFTASPRELLIPPATRVTFDASGSSDPERGRLLYDWNYGDGSSDSETSVTTTHVYTDAVVRELAPGSSCDIIVRLTVTDESGRRASTEDVVRVTRSIPSPAP